MISEMDAVISMFIAGIISGLTGAGIAIILFLKIRNRLEGV
ncbi:MAG: hypothetical protein QXL78_03290 [Methanocellales archaeon]